MIKRANFTLIEMVLVISLLALIGSTIGFVSYRSSKQEEFKVASAQVERRLRFAEELMHLGTDLDVTFQKRGKELLILMEPDHSLNLTTMKLLALQSPITGIDEVEFNQERLEKIRLQYLSKGLKQPQGEIHLKGPYGETSITLGNENATLSLRTEELYPYEILQKKI